MNLQTFKAPTMAAALSQVKRELGGDAVILHTRTYQFVGWALAHRFERCFAFVVGQGPPYGLLF